MSPLADVKRELLVRYLDHWAPVALHRGRRATVALAGADPAAAEATLRTLAEFADLLRRRTLTLAVIGPPVATLDPLQRELGTPPELSVLPVAGEPAALVAPALSAAGTAGAPLLAYLDGIGLPAPPAVAAVLAAKPGELLAAADPATLAGVDWRAALHDAGFPLVTGVHLVADERTELLVFATGAGRGLEAFKDALWAVDEYAGIRYRDPRDPAGHLLDISLHPHPGPLRRELLARLAAAGPATVTDLRVYTLTETVYRAADATGALNALLATGAVTRDPPHGRLGGDVIIRPVT
ncbi:hypothetical protein [Rhizomonospora bruguierae]|uniref:hypothetical protein n=1 Tax=Rhizomonospora bruguierae TaxID=1581705 RepID=UPI001BCAA179|nr:hypothetical protein [Micromonospora sp. NBRC 107566]